MFFISANNPSISSTRRIFHLPPLLLSKFPDITAEMEYLVHRRTKRLPLEILIYTCSAGYYSNSGAFTPRAVNGQRLESSTITETDFHALTIHL